MKIEEMKKSAIHVIEMNLSLAGELLEEDKEYGLVNACLDEARNNIFAYSRIELITDVEADSFLSERKALSDRNFDRIYKG